MGYYTYYELQVIDGDMEVAEVLEKLFADSTYEFLKHIIDQDGESLRGVKWYDHEEDMKEISKMFPDHIFLLHGEGEDNGDLWDKYFRDGKMQTCHATITYPPFDPSKLR